MKIKHWQGYGCVNAKKIETGKYNDEVDPYLELNFITIEVTGEHEWGLFTDDLYTINRWLLDKFVKVPHTIHDYTYASGKNRVIYQIEYTEE